MRADLAESAARGQPRSPAAGREEAGAIPVRIKIIFSIVVLAVAILGYFFLESLGQDVVKYLSPFLGVFSVLSFWIFPEVNQKK